MKIIGKALVIFFASIVLFGAVAASASAANYKELEPCYHCDSTGEFHCRNCGNKIELVCDGCGGAGGSECPGEEGKGKCDNGWYVCPSCHGDGLIRTGDGEIPIDAAPGSCGQCGGSGKLECWTCHGAGWNACTRCGGTGKVECQNLDCIEAREIDFKCPYCKGTGYLGNGPSFPPEHNDGIHNVPHKGDHIIVNNATWEYYVYGEDNTSSESVSSQPVTPGIDQVSTADPVSSGTYTDPVSDVLSDIPSNIPGNRDGDYDVPVASDSRGDDLATAKIVSGEMTLQESEYYKSLSEEELSQKISDLQAILGSVQPRRFESGAEDIINRIARDNGFDDLKDARMLPLYFEGHLDLGFPVQVKVRIEKGVLNGGSDIFVYHIADDGSIECLGKAEYSTYEDGSVETVLFYTKSFSSFFTAGKELDIKPETAADSQTPPAQSGSDRTNGGSGGIQAVTIIETVVIVIAAAAFITGIILIVKKKK